MLSFSAPLTSAKIPKYPVILCHGFSGFDHLFALPAFNPSSTIPLTDKFKELLQSNKENQIQKPIASSIDNRSMLDLDADTASNTKYLVEYWNGVREHLKSKGCTILVAKVPPFAGIETRALALHNFILKSVPKLRKSNNVPNDQPVKINLVAHSMGGLDCRYLIHLLNNRKIIHNIKPKPNSNNDSNNDSNIILKTTTLPYQIVSLTTISTPHRGTSAADFAMNYTPTSIITNYFPSIFQLTTSYMKNFNNLVKDDPNVRYFSYGATFTPNPASMFLITWKIVYDNEGDNDGLVSLSSCKWGKFIGYLDDVDHADLINWMGPMKMVKLAMGVPNFNPKYFYLSVMDNLASNGF